MTQTAQHNSYDIIRAMGRASRQLGGAHKGNVQERIKATLVNLGWSDEKANNAALALFDVKSVANGVKLALAQVEA